MYDFSIIDEFRSAVNSAIDARARRGWFWCGRGAFRLYSDTLYWSLDLVDIVGVVDCALALVLILVAHADEAQTRLTKGGGWNVKVPERGKEPGHLTFSRIRREAPHVWKRSSSGDGFFFCFAEPKPYS